MVVEAVNQSDEARNIEIQAMNVLLKRLSWFNQIGMTYGGDRDLYNALGWKTDLTYDDYWHKYDRQDIARRIVNAPVNTTWRGKIDLLSDQNKKPGDDPLGKDWDKLERQFRLTTLFTRADKLCRIGEYSVILLGFDDVTNIEDFAKPVGGVDLDDVDFGYFPTKGKTKRRLLYAKVFSQHTAIVHQYNNNPNSPRFWLPELYKIKILKPDGSAGKEHLVHHSRIVHIVEDVLENEVFGIPTMRAMYNRLDDLEKIVGGSAEMFWRGARPGYAAMQDKDTEMGDKDREAFQKEIDNFAHDITRWLRLKGIDVKELAPQVSDPSSHVEVQLKMISAVSGIPIRILIGSERGELASTQDDDNYFTRIAERRTDHAEPNIARPVVNRLMFFGVLPMFEDYHIDWEDLWSPSDKEKSDIAKTYSEALAQYFKANMEDRIPFDVYLKEVLQWEDEIIDKVVRYATQMQKEEEKQAEEDSQAFEDQGLDDGEEDQDE